MITVGIVMASVIGYAAVGGYVAGYAVSRHERHMPGCDNCGWPLLGFIWPLYLMWIFGLYKTYDLAVEVPYRLALRQAERRKSLPKAKVVSE